MIGGAERVSCYALDGRFYLANTAGYQKSSVGSAALKKPHHHLLVFLAACLSQQAVADEIDDARFQTLLSEHSADQGSLDSYAFLDALAIDDFIFDQQEEWLFSIELNNAGDDGAEYRQLLSLSKIQLFSTEDMLLVDVETDSLEHYRSLSWFYDTGGVFELGFFDSESMGLVAIEWQGSYAQSRLDNDITSDTIDDISWETSVYTIFLLNDFQWGLGVRWQAIDIGMEPFFSDGSESQFFLPGITFRWLMESKAGIGEARLFYERNLASIANTESVTLSADICVNFFVAGIGGCPKKLASIAEVDVGVDFQLLRAEYEYTLGIDTFNIGYFEQSRHRLRIRGSGQMSFGDALLPQFQQGLGGLYSVRGYGEQLLAGDNTLALTAEYRVQLSAKKADYEAWGFVFYDWGWLEIEPLLTTVSPVDFAVEREIERPGEEEVIRSIGVGVDIGYQQSVHLTLVWGQALADDNVEIEAGESRLQGYIRFDF